MNKLETLVTKIDQLNQVQSQIQKSFDNLETRFTLSQQMDDVPQCGRRVDRVLRTLTPLVSRGKNRPTLMMLLVKTDFDDKFYFSGGFVVRRIGIFTPCQRRQLF